jgi:hypothetical protein
LKRRRIKKGQDQYVPGWMRPESPLRELGPAMRKNRKSNEDVAKN